MFARIMRVMADDSRPDPTPEGELIRRAMVRKGVNAPDIADAAGISAGRWRHIVNGAQPLGQGRYNPVIAPAATLARMARAVDVTPEQLTKVGRKDAAEVLRDLADEDQPTSAGDFTDPITGERYEDPDEREIWGLTPLAERDRRELIYHLRARKAARQAEEQPGRGRAA